MIENLSSYTIEEIQSIQYNAEKLLTEKRLERQRQAIDKINAIARDYGCTVTIYWEDEPKTAKPAATKGAKIADKYRGPNGETWSGRGIKPRWLKTFLDLGHNLEDFAVAK